MKILAVDIGTGTQDILLLDTRLAVENAYKLVLPAPTMVIHRKLQDATRKRLPVLLSGVIMGGGPSQWAAEAHAKAGLPLFATPQAAMSFNDDLTAVEAMGIKVIAEDEAKKLPGDTLRVQMQDFDFSSIRNVFHSFGVGLDDLRAVAVAVFDHGAAPPDISDRQFRFDYLDERIRKYNRLSAFAFLRENIPGIMTRLQAVADSNNEVPFPFILMDTAPAAVLGATFDPHVQSQSRALIANIGNFHTLAFRLGPAGIEGVFEHHTGLLTPARLEKLILSLADSSLKHQDVFEDHGHGALIYSLEPLDLTHTPGKFIATGPRRGMLQNSLLAPYFAVPFGDMMIAGCFGLLASVADLIPDLHDPIMNSLHGSTGTAISPWDI
ncbi:MAG: DUF1786 domain-containing protein [Anaerolineaceae bacterium]|nr:DUF1786 domain-containing protein [Anaerolineaceae bacterium]